MVISLSSHFFAEPTHMLSTIRGKDAEGNRATTERWTEPSRLSPKLAYMPVEVLISERSFSAAESFAFGLQATGRARIIGARSGGGGFSNDFFPLGEGLGVSLSVGRTFDFRTGKGWQITGVQPDVPVESDHALSTAIELITHESGKLAALSSEERRIHAVTQGYATAWYGADVEAMDTSITDDFVATFASLSGLE